MAVDPPKLQYNKKAGFYPASLTHDYENKSYRRPKHTRWPVPCMLPVVGTGAKALNPEIDPNRD
jgi:hypothetical protein